MRTQTASAAPPLPRELLVVEDDPVQLKVYAALASRYGVSIRTTQRTTDVLRLAMQHQPDAILLDYELEDGPSLKVLRTLRASPETAHIPVGVVSGYLSDPVIDGIRALGEVRMLEKPWTIDQLVSLLRALRRDRERRMAGTTS